MMDRASSTRARRGIIGATVALLVGLGTVVAAVPASAAGAPAPSLSVSPSTGLDPDGATITVDGHDFDTSAANAHGAGAAGVYVEVGWLAPTWRESQGAPSTARTNAYTVWVQGTNPTGGLYVKWTDNGDGTADFHWTTTIDKATLDAKRIDGGTLAVFTVGAGGVVQAVNELAQPISFADPGADDPGTDPGSGGDTPGQPDEGATPAVTIASRTVHDDGTLDLTVTGSGFGASIAGNGQGIYVAVGPKIGDDWYLQAARFQVAKWVHAGVTSESASQALLASDGTFTVHLTGLTPTFTGGGVTYDQATTPFSVLTMAAHGSPDRSFDTATPVSFAPTTPGGGSTTTPTAPPTTKPTTPAAATVTGGSGDDTFAAGDSLTLTAGGFAAHQTGIRLELHSTPVVLASGLTADASGVVKVSATIPTSTPAGSHTLVLVGGSRTVEYPITVTAPACVARSVAGATLTWGVRASFRSYITGPIANGAIATTGVSGSGPWTWSGGTGRFNAVDRIGAASWSGGVHFTGHDGALDLTFSAPRITVTSASSATLSVLVTTPSGSSRVALATLRLSAGTHSTSSSRVAWSNVPATLTSAGAQAFEGFYQAGEALDPVTFALPLGAEVECDPSTGALAATGSDSGGLAALAALLVASGVGMVVVATRRRRHADVAIA